MFRKVFEIIGGYVVVKTIFVAGKNYGELKMAMDTIKGEAKNLRSNLKNREESRNYA